MTVFGTRPEIIRLSLIIQRLDALCEQTLVHTGQNFDPNLSDVFFRELGLRQPDVHLDVQTGDFADQVGQILSRVGKSMTQVNPDRVLILGDTNSGLAAIVAARLGIPVFHLEAGNRCYDDRVPEEINRRIIDHSSSILMPYTHRSKENLLREGIDRDRIFVVGNPIYEVLQTYGDRAQPDIVLKRLGLNRGGYFLVTLHRAENVNDASRLANMLDGLRRLHESWEAPIVVSLHPHTADRMSRYGLQTDSNGIRLLKPLGFLDFVGLERNSRCVLTDSGTVQEECCILGIPNVTLRDVTERPETIECGSNILTGSDPDAIVRATSVALRSPAAWPVPSEYTTPQASFTVAKIVLGYHRAAQVSGAPASFEPPSSEAFGSCASSSS